MIGRADVDINIIDSGAISFDKDLIARNVGTKIVTREKQKDIVLRMSSCGMLLEKEQ